MTLQDGPFQERHGRVLAHASLSARQAAALGLLTSGTYGPAHSGSSSSAALQRSLESRLQARLVGRGSILYSLTWKELATPAGRPICALRASVRRTLDSACIGRPTPGAVDSTSNAETAESKMKRGLKTGLNLTTVAQPAGWSTPKSEDAESTGFSARRLENNKTPDNLHSQTKLLLGTWATPATRDYRTPNHVKWSERGGGKKGEQLQNQVAHMIPGASLNGLPAAAERCGLLNPAFSLWLQGFPGMWARCAALVTRSTRTSRRSSSRHVCK